MPDVNPLLVALQKEVTTVLDPRGHAKQGRLMPIIRQSDEPIQSQTSVLPEVSDKRRGDAHAVNPPYWVNVLSRLFRGA